MSYNSLFGLGTHSADADLQGWWKLDDNAASTVVTDYSGNANHGTLQGGSNTSDLASTSISPYLTNSLVFDGSADYVDLPLNFAAYPYTLGCRCRNDGGNAFIFTQGYTANTSVYYATATNSGVYAVNVRNTINRRVTGTTAYGGVDSIAGVFDNNNDQSLFVNGVLEATQTTKTTQNASVDQMSIGALLRSTASNFFQGPISDAWAFSRSLTASELSEADAGPEPLNLTAPTLSQGTYTISTTDGTWDSQANGAIGYTYSWEYADDASGTNPVAISAVASTISPTSAMSGKFIRVTVSASNDGGSDSAEDQVSAWTAITAVPRGLGSEVAQWCPSWQDDSAESTVTDYTGNGHDLTNYNTGAGNWVADTNEGGVRAVDLNGVDEYHSGSAALDGLVGTDFTLSIWTKKDNTNGGHMLGLYQDQFGISTTQDHHALWHSTSSTYGTSALSYRNTAINRLVHASNQAPSNPTTWRHILATYSWSGSTLTITLYIDGVQIASQLGAVTIDYAMNLTAIGANIRLNGPTAFLDGRWDDARIFNSVLTQDEITHLASARGVEGSPGGGPTFKPFFAINATRIVR